jgi:succinate dehydrogenase flavin-adding protein (antitoxin of CptAB toxin-antitoxin module)
MLWSLRRGQLELDLWLTPLVDAWYGLPPQDREAVFRLLDESDEVLWEHFLTSQDVISVVKSYVSH